MPSTPSLFLLLTIARFWNAQSRNGKSVPGEEWPKAINNLPSISMDARCAGKRINPKPLQASSRGAAWANYFVLNMVSLVNTGGLVNKANHELIDPKGPKRNFEKNLGEGTHPNLSWLG